MSDTNLVEGQASCNPWIQKSIDGDHLSTGRRAGVGGAIVCIGLVSLFFYAHQLWANGFFTASFGPTEQFLLYAGIFTGAVGPIARAISGSKNAARPAEAGAIAFWIFSTYWLLAAFPFNFAHFGDVAPSFLQPAFSWITNEVARIAMIIGIIGAGIGLIFNLVMYAMVKLAQSMAHKPTA